MMMNPLPVPMPAMAGHVEYGSCIAAPVPSLVSEVALRLGCSGVPTVAVSPAVEVENSSTAFRSLQTTEGMARSQAQQCGEAPALLSCDVCKEREVAVLSLPDRKVLCAECDALINNGKRESEAPRFRLEARRLPRLSFQSEQAPIQVLTARTKTIFDMSSRGPGAFSVNVSDSQLLLQNEASHNVVAGNLLDIDAWLGTDMDFKLNQGIGAKTETLSAADSGECDSLEGQTSFFSAGGDNVTPISPESMHSVDSIESRLAISYLKSGPHSRRRSVSASNKNSGAAVAKRCSSTGISSHRVGKRCWGNSQSDFRQCVNCGVTKTPQWRAGPLGQKTLCNACGVRYKAGRLIPVVAFPPPGYSGPVSPPPLPRGRAPRNCSHQHW